MADSNNKTAVASLSAAGTLMTIRERPYTMIGSANEFTALFGAFRRSLGYEIDDERMPNCVYANWPAAQQKIAGDGVEKANSRFFITVTSTSSEKENAQKSVHLHLEQDKSVERRILSIPAHILRWIRLKSGDEVSVQLNNDLSRGFSEGKEGSPAASLTISRIQVKIQIAALREFSKLSLNADSLANCFRQTFLHDVLNVGQNCLLTFECSAAGGISTQQNERRKRKCVEMKEEHRANDDLEPPQHKKGLAASTFISALFGWTGFERNSGGTHQQYTIEAKILALYRPQLGTVNSDAEAQFGLVKEGTHIVFCPIAESGLCLYGDPAIISNSSVDVKTNVEDGENETKDEKKENGTKATPKFVKLIVQQFSKEMKCQWTPPEGDDHCLLHSQDYNVVTKKFSEASDDTSFLNTHTQQGSVRRRQGLIQKIYILITYKVPEGTAETKSTENDKKERQIVWSAVNLTNTGARGERGKIYMSHELMEELKIEPGDEVTVQSFDQEKRMAKQIKMEIENCDESQKCPSHHWLFGHPKCTSLFHVNDIVNTFKRNFSGRIVNLNISSYLKVEDKEIKKSKKSIKTNMFDHDEFEAPCLKFRVTEIQASNEEKKSTNEETSSNSSGNSSFETTKTVDKTSSFSAEFATIKKSTIIEIKIKTEDDNVKQSSKLILFGIEDQSNNKEQPPSKLLLDEKSWNFDKKIGGLNEQLGEIFRRAFASRMISAECCKQMGLKHLRGILLYGPPGTGKTLIARELAKALNAREPKIINGAEVQSKWLGESEKNVRSLFVDAEREQALAGDKSRLHVIIVDELDALCPNRQLTMSSHRTEQRIVNTVLAKLDGVEQLNNILLIGMTNLMETIDPALLRPGRLELKIHIGLPSEKGRREILDIHTNIMRETKRLHEDVNFDYLAKKTANFSGAELEGLVRAAQSQAIQRIIKAREQNAKENISTIGIDPSNDSDLKICLTDFELAFENDIKPAFGKGSMDGTQLNAILCREPILWSPKIVKLLEKGANLVEKLMNSNVSSIGQSCFLLLNGPMQSGKTFLATTIAHRAGIPYIRLINADSMLTSSNMQEKTPTGLLDQIIFDCENTDFACIIYDELEQIIGYNEVNGHGNWHHTILQKLAIIFNRPPKKGKRLLLVATSCEGPKWFEQMQLPFCLQNRIELPGIDKFEDVINFLGAATKNEENSVKTVENGTVEKLFAKCELDSIAKEIGPKLDGGGGRQLMPTIKNLVELIEWHSNQCNAKTIDGALTTNGQHESTNAEQIRMASTSFEKFKQKLMELIEQKRASTDSYSRTHLSMYR